MTGSSYNSLKKAINELKAEIADLSGRLALVEERTTPKEPHRTTGVTIQNVAKRCGASGHKEIQAWLKHTMRVYCQTHNLEIKMTPNGALKRWEYFPEAAADFAIEQFNRARTTGSL